MKLIGPFARMHLTNISKTLFFTQKKVWPILPETKTKQEPTSETWQSYRGMHIVLKKATDREIFPPYQISEYVNIHTHRLMGDPSLLLDKQQGKNMFCSQSVWVFFVSGSTAQAPGRADVAFRDSGRIPLYLFISTKPAPRLQSLGWSSLLAPQLEIHIKRGVYMGMFIVCVIPLYFFFLYKITPR